ncbi:S8 family serine peptidase [Pauljensenia sp. 20925_1_27]
MVSLSSHAAPRSPFSFVGRAGRAARALTTVASALALAAGALTLVPAPAHADDAVPSQEYFSYYPLNTVHQKGITGKGVTIAVIGGPVDTSNPALKGANITDKSRCTIQDSPEGVRHNTDMAIILVSPISGVAPDATLYNYQASASTTTSNGSCDSNGDRLNTIGALINQAVEDGAQFISISQSVSDSSNELKWAVTNAITKGVIIVASAGNGATDENITQLGRYSGVVGVSAINSDGTFASYSSWGDGVVTAAFGGPYTTYDVNTGEPVTVHGTSISAPLVAGMLALARQKWPDATTNQILQLLVHTGLNPDHDWNKYTGYGAAALGSLVNQDPSQYPDENPIIQKNGGSEPTAQEVQDYIDGVAGSLQLDSFPDTYVYRGAVQGVVYDHGSIPVHLGTSPRYHRK